MTCGEWGGDLRLKWIRRPERVQVAAARDLSGTLYFIHILYIHCQWPAQQLCLLIKPVLST
jgi:hypothetical protein